MIGSALCALALVAATALAACGGGDDSDGTRTIGSLGPPPVEETIEEAQERFEEAYSSDDCEEVYDLFVLSTRSEANTEARCRALQRMADREVSGAASYGDLGGVIEYSAGDDVISAVLIRDADGLFHIVLLDSYNRRPTVGTPKAKQFDAAARAAVNALQDEDCQAFLEVANRRFGVGALTDQQVCQTVKANSLAAALAGKRKVRLKPLGGNGSYAFYGLQTPSVYFIVVAAKASRDVPKSLRDSGVATKLPPGAATYGYVQAYAIRPVAEEE
jgi:hypothetical protein